MQNLVLIRKSLVLFVLAMRKLTNRKLFHNEIGARTVDAVITVIFDQFFSLKKLNQH